MNYEQEKAYRKLTHLLAKKSREWDQLEMADTSNFDHSPSDYIPIEDKSWTFSDVLEDNEIYPYLSMTKDADRFLKSVPNLRIWNSPGLVDEDMHVVIFVGNDLNVSIRKIEVDEATEFLAPPTALVLTEDFIKHFLHETWSCFVTALSVSLIINKTDLVTTIKADLREKMRAAKTREERDSYKVSPEQVIGSIFSVELVQNMPNFAIKYEYLFKILGEFSDTDSSTLLLRFLLDLEEDSRYSPELENCEDCWISNMLDSFEIDEEPTLPGVFKFFRNIATELSQISIISNLSEKDMRQLEKDVKDFTLPETQSPPLCPFVKGEQIQRTLANSNSTLPIDRLTEFLKVIHQNWLRVCDDYYVLGESEHVTWELSELLEDSLIGKNLRQKDKKKLEKINEKFNLSVHSHPRQWNIAEDTIVILIRDDMSVSVNIAYHRLLPRKENTMVSVNAIVLTEDYFQWYQDLSERKMIDKLVELSDYPIVSCEENFNEPLSKALTTIINSWANTIAFSLLIYNNGEKQPLKKSELLEVSFEEFIMNIETALFLDTTDVSIDQLFMARLSKKKSVPLPEYLGMLCDNAIETVGFRQVSL